MIGRAAELRAVERFLDGSIDRPGVLVLEGEPGIGKTTLWESGVRAGRERGMRVLTTRASGAEARLSFAALTDLLESVDEETLDGLPSPQRHALDVALLRVPPGDVPAESRAVALGFLNVVRELATQQPLLIAIDDKQWLDTASADALVFAGRRLEREAVIFLIARRPGEPCPLERALERRGRERIQVGPLGLAPMGRLLREQLALSVSRQLLQRLVDATRGNPFFAIEVGRTLLERGLPGVGEELPVPGVVEELLGTRVAGLPPAQRTLLLGVALSGDLRASQLAALESREALGEAVAVGLLAIDATAVRPSHPLLAAAVIRDASLHEQRGVHARLADVVADPELRAIHLALAADEPDETLAAIVGAAAGAAAARGAAQEAVVLAEHALRLTEPGAPAWSRRVLELGDYLLVAGEKQRLTDAVAPALDSLPRGEPRVRAYLLLTGGIVDGRDDIVRLHEQALAECGDDGPLRALVLSAIAEFDAVILVGQLPQAEATALEAVEVSRGAGVELERAALYTLSWVRALRGQPVDDLCKRFQALAEHPSYLAATPDRVAGQRLMWRGEIERARAVLEAQLQAADERSEPYSYALQRLHVCQLALRTGECDRAERLLDEWEADRELLIWPMYERCRSLLGAAQGDAEGAERWAAETMERAERTGARWDVLEALRARGIAALLAGEPERAEESLGSVWAHTLREGIEEPGVFPVAPELVEALVELGRLGEARAVTDRLEALATELDHPWARVTAARCHATIELASAYDDESAARLEDAAALYGRLGLAFDRARSFLVLGRAQRRAKKWAAARASLEDAAAAFDALGSAGWAALSRSELERVGARRPRPTGALTPSEQRVAELVGEGLSNKEIALRLVVSVRTVEAHLSHAYGKLGVTSRAQLARRLTTPA